MSLVDRTTRNYLLPLVLLFVCLTGLDFVTGLAGVPLNVSIGDVLVLMTLLTLSWVWRAELLVMLHANRWLLLTVIVLAIQGLAVVGQQGPYFVEAVKFTFKVVGLMTWLSLLFACTSINCRAMIGLAVVVIGFNVIGILEFCKPEWIDQFLIFLNARSTSSVLKYQRVSSLFVNPNPYGSFNALIVVAVYSVYKFSGISLPRWFVALLLSFCLVGVVISGSRAAMFTLACGVLMLLVVLIRRRDRTARNLAVAVLMVGLVFGLGAWYNSGIAKALERVVPAAAKLNQGQEIGMHDFIPHYVDREREKIWQEGLALYRQVPVLGLGANQFLFANSIAPGQYNMHNIFGEALVNYGLLGLGLFFFLLSYWLRGLRSDWQLLLALTMIVSHLFDCYVTYNIFWIILVPWLFVLTTRDFGAKPAAITRAQ